MSEQEHVDQFHFSLSTPDLKFAIGIFTMMGFTLGLTGAFALSYFNGGETASAILTGFLSVTVLTVGLLLGPAIGTVVGLRVHRADVDNDTKYTTAAIGTFLGYIAMIVVLVLVLTISFGLLGAGGQAGGGTGGDTSGGIISIGDLLVPLIGFAIPTGIMGVAATWLSSRFGIDRRVRPFAGESDDVDSSTPVDPDASSFNFDLPTEEAVSKVRSTFNEDAMSSLNKRLQLLFDDVSYLYAISGGILTLLITSVVVAVLVGFDPVLGQTGPSLFNLGIISMNLSEFGIRNSILARFTWLSWMVLLAHGVTIEGLSIDLVRIELIRTVPWVMLIAIGYLISKLRNPDSLPTAFIHGGSIAVGYAPVVFVFALLATGEVNAGGSSFIETSAISASLVDATFKAGIVYPVVFGGIGGAIQYFRGSFQEDEEGENQNEPIE